MLLKFPVVVAAVKSMLIDVAVLDFSSLKNLESLFISPKGTKQSHFKAYRKNVWRSTKHFAADMAIEYKLNVKTSRWENDPPYGH